MNRTRGLESLISKILYYSLLINFFGSLKHMINCAICGSNNVCDLNTYKQVVYACNDCNSVFHLKNKKKYLFEYLLPSKLAKKILPQKAFARLFHLSEDDTSREEFYNIYLGKLNKKINLEFQN